MSDHSPRSASVENPAARILPTSVNIVYRFEEIRPKTMNEADANVANETLGAVDFTQIAIGPRVDSFIRDGRKIAVSEKLQIECCSATYLDTLRRLEGRVNDDTFSLKWLGQVYYFEPRELRFVNYSVEKGPTESAIAVPAETTEQPAGGPGEPQFAGSPAPIGDRPADDRGDEATKTDPAKPASIDWQGLLLSPPLSAAEIAAKLGQPVELVERTLRYFRNQYEYGFTKDDNARADDATFRYNLPDVLAHLQKWYAKRQKKAAKEKPADG
jgi:hypothetical protein